MRKIRLRAKCSTPVKRVIITGLNIHRMKRVPMVMTAVLVRSFVLLNATATRMKITGIAQANAGEDLS